jgi:hypothetical protein
MERVNVSFLRRAETKIIGIPGMVNITYDLRGTIFETIRLFDSCLLIGHMSLTPLEAKGEEAEEKGCPSIRQGLTSLCYTTPILGYLTITL